MAPNLHDIDPHVLRERRERVFLVLAGLFLGTLAMLNILGISRFIELGSIGSWEFAVAVGVLPYPVTFLCTDFISEFYGKRRANFVVMVGLLVNLWVVFVLWFGGWLGNGQPDPAHLEALREAIESTAGFAELDQKTREHLLKQAPRPPVYFEVQALTFGAVTASMIAYLVAQFVDVYVFHFWKRLTKGKHLWLRNNGSTLVSQFVDTVAVILITHFYARSLPVNEGLPILPQLWVFIASGYVFKLAVALLDTIPFYIGVRWLSRYLRIDPAAEGGVDGTNTAPPDRII